MRFPCKKECPGCGDVISEVDLPTAPGLTARQRAVLLDYCAECAAELALGIIFPTRAKLDSSGHGCPLEPNDDARPYQENAIRDMEGGR